MNSSQRSHDCCVCGLWADDRPTDRDGRSLRCPRCGDFFISRTAAATVENWSPERRIRVSGWIRDQNLLGQPPEINSNALDLAATRPLPSFTERADRILLYALRSQPRLGGLIDSREPAFLAIAYALNEGELRPFWDHLAEQGFIKGFGTQFSIGPTGYVHCDQLQSRQAASNQGFVAMWFDPSMTDAWASGFEPAILAAGYDPVRVDGIEHSGKIDDLIIAEIRRSRFVVADFTGHRGGVYFEAGFALGLDLPVIWTCREDDVEALHFDIRQYNTVCWSDAADLAVRLQRRIEAVVGDGPRKAQQQ